MESNLLRMLRKRRPTDLQKLSRTFKIPLVFLYVASFPICCMEFLFWRCYLLGQTKTEFVIIYWRKRKGNLFCCLSPLNSETASAMHNNIKRKFKCDDVIDSQCNFIFIDLSMVPREPPPQVNVFVHKKESRSMSREPTHSISFPIEQK